MEEGKKCRIVLMEAQKREYSVYCYGQREAQTAKNVTSPVNDSVAKWQVCKIGFRLVQVLFAMSYILSLQVGVVHFVHQHAPSAREPGNLFWLFKKLLLCIFFDTYRVEYSTEWIDCVQHEEGMQATQVSSQ